SSSHQTTIWPAICRLCIQGRKNSHDGHLSLLPAVGAPDAEDPTVLLLRGARGNGFFFSSACGTVSAPPASHQSFAQENIHRNVRFRCGTSRCSLRSSYFSAASFTDWLAAVGTE